MTGGGERATRLGAAGGGVSVAPRGDAAGAREHARLLVAPILARHDCGPTPLEAVLRALVDAGGYDGPAVVHWLLGAHPWLPAGQRPLDVWIAGAPAELLRLAQSDGPAPGR